MRKPPVPAKGFSHFMEHGIPWQTRGINSHRKKADVPWIYPVHQSVFITESIIKIVVFHRNRKSRPKEIFQAFCSLDWLPEHFTRHQELCIPDEIVAISWSQFISTPNHLKWRSMLNRCSLQGEQGGTSFNHVHLKYGDAIVLQPHGGWSTEQVGGKAQVQGRCPWAVFLVQVPYLEPNF